MADASPETIQRLIENSEKGLSQIEMSLPHVLETRLVVMNAIKRQGGGDVVLDLMLVVLDTILAENEVIYDLSASLDALLKAKDDYTKRFYMQSLNLCFWEACQLFAGEEGDEDGLLTKLEKLTQQLNQAGCQFIFRHIIDDVRAFRKYYCDKELRNITRHYDDPIKMYEKQQGLDNIDFFAKGASQLMAIRMEVSVLSSYLLNLLTPVKKEAQSNVSNKGCGLALKGMLNDAIFKAFKKNDFKKEVQWTLSNGQAILDDCYRRYNQCLTAEEFLGKENCQISEDFNKIKLLIALRMETLFLKYDVACSVWGYLNAASDMERSQNLRLIHITKQAALTHIYGYTETVREKSLWTAIKRMKESSDEELDTVSVETSLKELTDNLAEDKDISQIYAHYRYQQDFYIPARLEAFNKMEHHKELMDAMKLLKICKVLDGYTVGLLFSVLEKKKQETKRQQDEWMGIIDNFSAKVGDNEKSKEVLMSIRKLIEKMYDVENDNNGRS